MGTGKGLPLKRIISKAKRITEEPVGVRLCETCDQPSISHESWCPERMHEALERWRKGRQ